MCECECMANAHNNANLVVTSGTLCSHCKRWYFRIRRSHGGHRTSGELEAEDQWWAARGDGGQWDW